jgi:hypothetical protein
MCDHTAKEHGAALVGLLTDRDLVAALPADEALTLFAAAEAGRQETRDCLLLDAVLIEGLREAQELLEAIIARRQVEEVLSDTEQTPSGAIIDHEERTLEMLRKEETENKAVMPPLKPAAANAGRVRRDSGSQKRRVSALCIL